MLRKISPRTPVILGGIYATLYPEHAKKVTGADTVLGGSVDGRLQKVLMLEHGGKTSHWSEFVTLKRYAPLLTSYGCPMRCTYCASHVLNPLFKQMPVDDVYSEISVLYSKGVRNFAFYDDALLVNAEEHIIPLLRRVIGNMPGTTFFTPVGLQSRLITKEIAMLMRSANFRYLRIGYETGDPARQEATGGKVNHRELERGIRHLTDAGYDASDIGVFIMYGLPGQPIEEVEKAVESVKRFGVRVALSEFSPVAGTKEMEKLTGFDKNEPLLTNNTAYSLLFSGYDPDRVSALKLSLRG